MAGWLGDYPEDFTTVTCIFTTNQSSGATVAPLTAFETADVKIFKNGSATEKTSTNGLTMTSAFNGSVGLHCLVIDTSNDTGDSGFWTTGGGDVFTILLEPDTETVDGVLPIAVIGQFGINLSRALQPTTAGRKLDVTTTGAAGIDWGNVENLTTTNALTNTSIASVTGAVGSVTGAVGSVTGLTASDVGAIKTKTDFLPSATAGAAGGVFIAGTNAATTVTTSLTTTFTGNLTGSVGSVSGAVGSVTGAVGSVTGSVGSIASGGITAASFAADSITAAKLHADVTTELQAGLAMSTSISTLQTSVDDLPTNAELATALGTADDAVLAQVALVKAKTDSLTFTNAGVVDANIKYVADDEITGNGIETSDEWRPV